MDSCHLPTTEATGLSLVPLCKPYIAPPILQAHIHSSADALVTPVLQVNVEVREAPSHAGLGMFAARDIKEGDTIVSVPVDQGFTAVAANGVVVRTRAAALGGSRT